MNKILATAVALAALASPASAMDFKIVKLTPTENALIADGEIYQGDGMKAVEYLRNNPELEKTNTVFLNSNGGVIAESQWLAKIFRDTKMKTVVRTNGYCVSACFELWAAGTTRVAGSGARIGVHRIHINGHETVETQSDTIAYATRVSKLGVPRAILASMMMQPSAGMYYLTDDDIASMNAFRYNATEDVSSATPAPAPAQPSYQVSYGDTTTAPTDERTQKRIEFDETFEKAYRVSQVQNRGRAAAQKNCDAKGCELILAYKDKNGYYVEMHKSLNSDSRALCRMKEAGIFEDTYRCKNWLTGEAKDYRWSRDPLM